MKKKKKNMFSDCKREWILFSPIDFYNQPAIKPGSSMASAPWPISGIRQNESEN